MEVATATCGDRVGATGDVPSMGPAQLAATATAVPNVEAREIHEIEGMSVLDYRSSKVIDRTISSAT
jgi:hypothetical protein